MSKAPMRAIHLDFHTMPRVYDVGSEFDAREFAGTLAEAHVDYVTVFAKCNLGFAYYPTRIGTVHPGMKVPDLLGPMVEACHDRGIRVAAYLNTGLDHEHALRHRDWCKVTKDGRIAKIPEMGNFFRTMCLNTGYRANILGMVKEVLSAYEVDGLFLDCFDLSPCWGVECLDSMKSRGMDIRDDRQVALHTSVTTDEFLDQVELIVNRLRPGVNECWNGIRYRRQRTHLELEVLPTGSWGYDYLPFVIRYARTLDKPYFTMTGRFQKSWGDLGGLRTEQSILFDCYYSVANGGTCSIGDHLHPRGKLEGAVYQVVGRIYDRIRALEPWTTGSKSLAEIAVLDPGLSGVPGDREFHRTHGRSLQGAARMLSELKCQFDLVDGEADLSRYRVVILADEVSVDERLGSALRAHLDRGGFLVSSSSSGLKPDKSGFALPDYRLTYRGLEPRAPTFFRALPALGADVPDMPVTIYEPGIDMTAQSGATALAELHQPYVDFQEYDLYHEQLYCPPEQPIGRPALVRCGNVFHFSFPVFRGYIRHGVVSYRALVGACLQHALPEPLVRVANLPSFAQVTVAASGSKRLVHLLLYVPELRGAVPVVEDPIIATDVRVSLRTDGLAFARAYLAPSGERLELRREGGYATVRVPEARGYALVVFEA